jgi:GxxExxY protein
MGDNLWSCPCFRWPFPAPVIFTYPCWELQALAVGFLAKKFTTETRSSRRLHGTSRGDGRSAAIEVHRQLGPGLLESSYHACICRELELRAIQYQSQVAFLMEYKGAQIAKGYVIDLLVEESLIVEIKSVDNVLPIHSAQLLTYLRLQRLSAGLLINFNVHTLLHGLKRILS